MEYGCSSFTWITEDNKHLLGRTYDYFGNLDANKIIIVPRHHRLKLEVREESNGFAKGNYCFVGMGILGLQTPIMVDGINEKGLMGALLNYPGCAVNDTQRSEENINIYPGFFVTYTLSQCSSLEEVVSLVSCINLTNEKAFGQSMQVHYIFSDTTGEAVIIEPDENGITIHRATIGVMANSPDYMWHKTNLRNYVEVSNVSKGVQKIGNYKVKEFGLHSGGGFGLPSGYASPARFVRVAYFKEFATKGKDEIDGITKMFRNFATVDIPEGILKESHDVCDYEQTLCISGMCGESMTYYFSTYINRRISAIKLENELANTDIKYIDLPKKQDINYLN